MAELACVARHRLFHLASFLLLFFLFSV